MAQSSFMSAQSNARAVYVLKSPIETIPMELILEIMEVMGPGDLTNFGLTNRRFHKIFTEKRTQILLKILRSRPELELLLHLYTANQNDFLPDRMLHPLTVTFSFSPDDAPEDKVFLTRSPVAWTNGKIVCPEKIKLTMADLLEVAQLVEVVDWWVEVYPRLRWRDRPEDRRSLKSDEESRLRKAIARWWLYSHYFHGSYRRNTHAPKKFDKDVRLHHIRILTTQEIHELDDLLGTMYETISKDLCSSPGKVHRETGSVVELIPWGKSGQRHPAIVYTYMKLDPDLLKYFLEHCYRYSKDYLIMAITNSAPDLLFDRESLSMSIATVLEERAILDPDRPKTFPPMGISAEDRASTEECEAWNHDAWLTGFPPITREQLAEQPLELTSRIPHGDDGADRGDGY
ncbi:putative F-box domain-containing protein [Rosellinia necatrix]|uniref:Putative F-box domain-containing protein n=1 Tax=Rosellinia necatrix TaxID=77044 RepID=A0A1W2TUF7_ROSNE|nr:putative F-box domain-containing protein [Rosellinia necatrix]